MAANGISNISDIATEETNTTGVLTPILTFQPDDGTMLIVQNRVPQGAAPGIPIYGKLQDNGGNDLPLASTIALQYEQPTDDNPETVSEPRDNIRPYRALTVNEQTDAEKVDSVKHVLKGSRLVVRDIDKFHVVVDSSAQIDWTNSSLYIDENATRVVSE